MTEAKGRAAGLDLLREHALIAGEPVTSTNRIAVDDPATGESLGHVPDLGAAETERAIQAADEAFPAWSRSDPHRRAAFLRDWARLIDENAEGLAALTAAACNTISGVGQDASAAGDAVTDAAEDAQN